MLSGTTRREMGRSSSCVLGSHGSYHVRVETSVDTALIFDWQHGQRVHDSMGREVMRVMIRPIDSPHVLLREPKIIMDAIANSPFSILEIEEMWLVVLNKQTATVEVVNLDLEESVVWPAAHRMA